MPVIPATGQFRKTWSQHKINWAALGNSVRLCPEIRYKEAGDVAEWSSEFCPQYHKKKTAKRKKLRLRIPTET